ncbi:MAG: hypothetical protein QY331_07590 [Melioribacteraceae bacterium]|nr:MAG: hypothetical protein QY331_07590 [Melioribacteraceae bacterium]
MSLKKKRVIDPVLTTIARGFFNAEHVATSLFPVVTVTKEGGKILQFTKESFKVYNTERAIRAKSNRINPENKSSIDFALTEHDLEYPIDYREADEDLVNLQQHGTKVTSDGISLRLEKIAADLAQDESNYPSGNKETLASGDKFTTDTSDPIAIFEDAKEAVRSKIASYPNTAVIGASSFAALKQHPKIVDRVAYTTSAVVTIDLLKALLDIPNIVIGKAVYADDTGAFNDVWADNVVLAYVPQKSQNIERSLYEPSFGYTLRKKNMPMVDRYDESGKIEVVRTTDIFDAKILGADAGYLIKDTNA